MTYMLSGMLNLTQLNTTWYICHNVLLCWSHSYSKAQRC